MCGEIGFFKWFIWCISLEGTFGLFLVQPMALIWMVIVLRNVHSLAVYRHSTQRDHDGS
jgi:hypothetical protein